MKDKRAGVIQSDLYSNSIYTDHIYIDSEGSNDGSDDHIKNSRSVDDCKKNNNECFSDSNEDYNETRETIQNSYLNDIYLIDSCYKDNSNFCDGLNKSRSLICNLCKLDSHNDYLILSCCNSTFHIKCLINKYTKEAFSTGSKVIPRVSGETQTYECFKDKTYEYFKENTYECFNENNVTQDSFNKMICIHCNNRLNYEDIFTLYSKNIMCNKKFHTQYITQLAKLKDQKSKIETEIKCLNEYIDKLENDKTLSKIIMDKTYKLICD